MSATIKSKRGGWAAWLVSAAGCSVVASATSAHPTLERMRLNGDQQVSANAVFATSNATLLSQIPLSQFPSNPFAGNDIWGYVSPSGREYALMGLTNAMSVVEVTDPFNPEIIATFQSNSIDWRDVKTIGEYAYVVSESSDLGLQVIDLSQVDAGVVTEVRRVLTGGSNSTHNVVVNEETGFIYRVGGGPNIGLRAYATGKTDALGNPTPGTPDNPVFVGQLNNLYVHDAQVVIWNRPGPFFGRELAFACSGGGIGDINTALRIYDISDKNNVSLLRTIFYPSSEYSHQGWLSEDQRYFYLNDELDEGLTVSTTTMRIFDIDPAGTGDPGDAVFLRADTNGIPSIDHNLYVKDNLLFATNYTSGLRVFSLDDPTDPEEIATFDTFPASDNASFNGAWSNYPYLPSGNILISDINSGLFVVRLNLAQVSISPAAAPEFLSPSGGSQLSATFEGAFGGELDPSTVRLRVRDQSGSVVSLAGSPAGGNTFSFSTGPLDCGTSADYWFEAQTTAGDVVTLPAGAPSEVFTLPVASDKIVSFENSGEGPASFVISGNSTEGVWSFGTPVNNGRGDPDTDADGNDLAWLTDNNFGDTDVDEGVAILTTPPFDASDGGTLSWSYWLNDVPLGALGDEDFLRVEIATNAAGTNWVQVADYRSAQFGWREDSVIIGSGQLIGATPTLRVRFSAADNTPGDVVEAGIDAIEFSAIVCEESCGPADINGDGAVTGVDFTDFIAAFGAGNPVADQNGDGSITGVDFTDFIANFGQGCV